MSYQALYRAWRPNTFSDICDQDAAVRTLKHQVKTGQISHAYLFCGSRGTGKTTAAKILARAVNCLSPVDGDPCGECEICRVLKQENCMDVQEIDAASNSSVDEIRDLCDKIQYPPALTKYKVYIIDEVHALSPNAFNAFLKTLEEPPSYAVFILATTEPQKLLSTILSRCQRFNFHRIRVEAIVARLRVVIDTIGREADDDALAEIARASDGAMRDALSTLEMCLSYTQGKVDAALVRDVLGTTGRDFMFAFTDALIDWNAAAALEKIDEAMRRGNDPRVFSLDAAYHLRGILLADIAGDELTKIMEITPEDAARFKEQAVRANRDQLMRATELFMRVESEMKWTTQPRTMLELAAVRTCHPEQEQDAALAERLECIERKLREGAFVSAAPAAPAAAAKASEPAPKPAQQPKPAAGAPAETPPQAYLDAIAKFSAENPSLRGMLSKMRFDGIKDDVVTVRFGRDGVVVRKLLQDRSKLLEAALSDAFGQPMRLQMLNENETVAASAPSVNKAIDQVLTVFGRDRVDFID